MRTTSQGWTLAEVIVSTAVLGMILMIMAQALAATQRSWLTGTASAELTRCSNDAQNAVQAIRRATLHSHPVYDNNSDQYQTDSSQHFVCGPAAELIPATPGVCSDAIFFQRPTNEGELQHALQACGFFIQYGDDAPWRPLLLRSRAPRRRFRLMQFHQKADSLALPSHVSGVDTIVPRSMLYKWFATPVSAPGTVHSSAVAENVVAMTLRPQPDESTCHDSLRFRWAGNTPEARSSRHRLPHSIEIGMVVTDEASWSKLTPNQANGLAISILQQLDTSKTSTATLPDLCAWLQKKGINARISTMQLALDEFRP